ncbi:MAG: tRNA (N6-isopentenyl adenosine(37)-C2)-methylthiotransferase MiaB [Ruminococcaceae bacterium]|nr:tRNA (N6-isopentenyl adenosine(37)-C2)-methylthiotransferase MiaB [Oscillospiraceae bacterium]
MNNIFVEAEQIKAQLEIADKLNNKTDKKVCILTFGCQQNEADSEILSGICEKAGYGETDDPKEADLILINTCAIREHAELKALSRTGQFKKLKEQNKELLIGVCGCMAEQKERREALMKSYPYVDFVFGTDKLYMLPQIIRNAKTAKKRSVYISDLPHNEFGVIAEGLPLRRNSSHKAKVSIMYGCDNFCTYCVVPYVRGRERSRESGKILAEVENLVMRGYGDIMLLGQNVNSYKGDISFPKLLERAGSFNGEYFLRFMTSHPKDASRELFEVIRDVPNVAKQFHLPVQSGNNRVLSAMNRRYSREKYLEKALEIKSLVPGITMTTDIICGFPTETEKEFLETVDIIKQVEFDMIFTFLYSPRPGTPAAKMEDQIPHEEKVRRFELLSSVQNDIADKLNDKYVGKTVRVLCDSNENGMCSGRTSGNKIVNFEGNAMVGTFADVEITSAAAYILKGRERG